MRVHASSMVADIFQVSDYGKGPELHQAMKQIEAAGKGAVVFLNKTRHGGGLADELTAYANMTKAQSQGTYPSSTRKTEALAPKFCEVGVTNIKLLSNSNKPLATPDLG